MLHSKWPKEGQEEKERRVAVGIDPSRSALQIALLSPHGVKPREHRLSFVPASVKEFQNLVDSQDSIVAIEGASSLGLCFILQLLDQGYDIREVNPQVSKSFCSLLSEDHTDRKDAEALARAALLLPHLPQVAISVEQAAAKRLSRLHQRLVRDQTAYLNQLHACLAESYGSIYKSLFRKLATKQALHFFEQYPTVNDALTQETATQQRLGEEKWQIIKEAGTWTEGVYLDMLRGEVRVLTQQILGLKDRIRQVEREMGTLPLGNDVEMLTSMRGIGRTLAVTIVGETGRISRFRNNDAYAAYCGLAPAAWQSGGSTMRTKPRRRYNRRLRRAFLLLAFTQLRVNQRSRDYYWRKREEGKYHWAALKALARHLCRIVFAMLSEGRRYQDLASVRVSSAPELVLEPAVSQNSVEQPGKYSWQPLVTAKAGGRLKRPVRRAPVFHDSP